MLPFPVNAITLQQKYGVQAQASAVGGEITASIEHGNWKRANLGLAAQLRGKRREVNYPVELVIADLITLSKNLPETWLNQIIYSN